MKPTMRRPVGFWRTVIREGLRASGGTSDLVDLYAWIAGNVDLLPREAAESPHQGRPYYENTIRGIANDMADAGLLVRVARGRFRLPWSAAAT